MSGGNEEKQQTGVNAGLLGRFLSLSVHGHDWAGLGWFGRESGP